MKNIVKMENACGGKGCVTLECLLDEKQLNNKCGLYAHVIIEPGSTLSPAFTITPVPNGMV